MKQVQSQNNINFEEIFQEACAEFFTRDSTIDMRKDFKNDLKDWVNSVEDELYINGFESTIERGESFIDRYFDIIDRDSDAAEDVAMEGLFAMLMDLMQILLKNGRNICGKKKKVYFVDKYSNAIELL